MAKNQYGYDSEAQREAYLMREDAKKILQGQDYDRLKNDELLKSLASQYSKDVPEVISRSVEWIRAQVPIETARSEVLQMYQRRNQQAPVANIPFQDNYRSTASNFVGMSKRDLSEYSFCRILAASCNIIEEKSLGIEKEIHQDLLKNVHKEDRGKIRGLLVPHDVFLPQQKSFYGQRAPYAVGANSTGGYVVQTDVLADNFVEALRPVSMALQLGAQILGGLVGNAQIPTQADVSDTFWIAEGQALTQSESTFGALSMSPKTLGILSKYSRLMLLQSTPDIEQLIRRDFAQGMAVGLDAAVLAGTGQNNQPTGILNQANAQVYTVAGASGSALTYNDLIEMEYLSGRANALSQNLAWVGNAAIRKALRKTPKQADGVEGNFLWSELSEEMAKTYDTSIFGKCLGYMFGTTENIPSNYTKGSATTLNGLILGNFSNVLIGNWGVLEILSNPYGADDFSRGATTVRALQSVDIGIRTPESFVICKQFT